MSTSHAITRLLLGVKQAENDAVRALFDRCYRQVVQIAQRKLPKHRGFDEDDVANSAFREFLDRAAAGSFPRLENREDVWQILTMLVVDKVIERLRHELAKKRGGPGREGCFTL